MNIKQLLKTTLEQVKKLTEKNADLIKQIKEMKNAMETDLSDPKTLEVLITNTAGLSSESIIDKRIDFQNHINKEELNSSLSSDFPFNVTPDNYSNAKKSFFINLTVLKQQSLLLVFKALSSLLILT